MKKFPSWLPFILSFSAGILVWVLINPKKMGMPFDEYSVPWYWIYLLGFSFLIGFATKPSFSQLFFGLCIGQMIAISFYPWSAFWMLGMIALVIFSLMGTVLGLLGKSIRKIFSRFIF
ncbi:MAG TPA: hypothetical protein VHM20_07735 [Gammaproteobacteria bacterium]|jgi:hypothetical protein|nr:hypothetical protein [Gammaproteobacteria bacterium]